jgi:hypothetical protein
MSRYPFRDFAYTDTPPAAHFHRRQFVAVDHN